MIDVGAVLAILFLDVVGMRVVADGEAVLAVEAFAPPTVEDAEVQAAVAARLHAAGAARFERAARVVQPDIAAAHHLARDMDIVILDEDQFALHLAILAEVNDLLDELLALVVARMRLAGEDELQRTLLVMRQLHDVLELLEDERRALVGGEAAGEPDGQRVGIEQMIEGDEVALAEAFALDEQAAAAELDQFPAQPVTERPEFLVSDKIRIGHLRPELGCIDRRFPAAGRGLPAFEIPEAGLFARGRTAPTSVELATPEATHRALHPAEQMNAVGDVADGHLVLGQIGPETIPHVPAHLAVEFTHAVGGPAGLEREHRHAERLVGLLRIHSAQSHQVIEGNLQQILHPAQGVIHQLRAEPVVSGLDRRVGGEETFALRGGKRVGEGFPEAELFADEFQREEGGVSLVHVKGGGLDAQRAEQAHAADAEHDLLHDARAAVTAVHAQGQVAIMLLVLGQIRVEEQHRHAPDVHAPRLEFHHAQADLDRADDGLARLVRHRLDRKILRAKVSVVVHLPALVTDGLLEVTFAIEQADADEAEVEIAGGLGVVAREDAQAAGGDGQRFMEAKLGAEIGDGIFLQCARVAAAPGVRALEVFVEVGQHPAHAFAEGRVLQMRAQLLLGDFAQDGHGVVVKILPATRREFLEDFLRALIPGPPQVAGEPVQAGDHFL